jgi:hypothetical protein
MTSSTVFRKWLLTAVALLAVYWGITRVVVFSSVDRHLTPAWFEYRDMTEGLLLRMEHSDGSAILITRNPRFLEPDTETEEDRLPQNPMFPVYRYTPGIEQIILASAVEWLRAEGPPIDDARSSIPCDIGLRWDRSAETIQFKQRVLRTAGSLIVACRITPDRTKAAIMSAGGPRMFAFIPIFGDPGTFGPHYQQVFSLETGEFVGDTVRLPFITAVVRDYIYLCWSPDKQSIVYAQYLGDWISIVPVESR